MGAEAGVPDRGISPAERLLERRAQAGTKPPRDSDLSTQCPLLWSVLTQTRYRDGTIRVPATLKVEASDGWWLVTLQDHASNQQCTCYAETLADVPYALERLISGSDDAWRPFKSMKVRNPFKRQKPLGP